MLIREAALGDLPAIRSVGERTWPPTYGFAGGEYVAAGLARWWSDEALRASLRDTTVLVADDGGALVGVGNLDLRGEVPVIWKLYVLPEQHGRGVGSALLDALTELAAGRPVRLEYMAGNDPAARFYTARGFVEIGREAPERPGWPELVWVERR